MTSKLGGKGVDASVAEHDACEPVPASVHDAVGAKVTVPDGVDAVPVSVSLTVAVHNVDWPTSIVDGVHVTAVDVARLLTVTLAGTALLLLPLWEESPL